MIDLAKTFSSKTFNYQEAAQLTMYLEPDATADNSDLGEVSINCSFSQITWGGLDVELEKVFARSIIAWILVLSVHLILV